MGDTHRTLSGSCLVFVLLQKTDTGQETEVHSPVQERQNRIRSERFYSARPLTVVRGASVLGAVRGARHAPSTCPVYLLQQYNYSTCYQHYNTTRPPWPQTSRTSFPY